VRRESDFPPVTMGHIRVHGCRDLLEEPKIAADLEL